MTAPTRRQVMAGSLAALGAAGAPAIAEAPAHPPPTPEQWARWFAAWYRMTPARQREVLAYAEELLAEQKRRS